MGASVRTALGSCKAHRYALRLAALLLLSVATVASAGEAAETGTGSRPTHAAPDARPTPESASKLSKITIEGMSERELRAKVDHFVAAVVTPPPSHESLLRWNTPVCPLVVGLPRKWGELVLAHISQAARDAHARLAGRHCQPNLFIVVSAQPDEVLKQWMAHRPQVDTKDGIAPLEHFLHSKRPVRVWYNPQPGCAGGSFRPGSAGLMSGIGLPSPGLSKHVAAGPPGGMGPTYCDNSIDTHLMYGEVRSIGYAIVVADMNELHRKHVTLGQLADYVSLVGLADVRLDADGAGAPTILRLFDDANPPEALTPWDRALLYSLYNTTQSGKLQLTDMEVSMVRRIAP
jgi:hypothetical protein